MAGSILSKKYKYILVLASEMSEHTTFSYVILNMKNKMKTFLFLTFSDILKIKHIIN